MRTGLKRSGLFSRGRVGLFAAAGALALAAIPAGAQADLIVPHASEPRQVEVHAAPAPAQSRAPAFVAAAAPGTDAAPSSSTSSHPVGDDAEPEENLPGADLPPGDGERPYPSHLPSPWGPGCGLNCLLHWHDWYFSRRINIGADDPEAVILLQQEQDAIDDMIRQAGGVPGSAATDGPIDEPTGPNIDEVSGHAPVSSSTGLIDQQGALSGGGNGIVTAAIDGISGAGPIVPENGPIDLGTVDMTDWIDRVASATMVPTFLSISQKLLNAIDPSGSANCPKKGVDDEVPVCQK